MSVTPVSVLLLENDPGDARLVQLAIAEGAPGEFAVTLVGRLVDALALLQAKRFDVVLSSLGLPDSAGLATVCAIVTQAPELALVVLSGWDDEEVGRGAIRNGAQDYLVKGNLNGEGAARALRYAIERKRIGNELREANGSLERRVAERTLELRTELRTAVARLTESEVRYRSLTESATDGIIVMDAEGNIAGWNPAAEGIFGYQAAEVMGKPLTTLMPRRYRDAHLARMKRVLSDGESHVIGKTVELGGLRKDGSEFPVELSLTTWKNDRRFISGTIRDITERKRTEEKLRAAEEQFRGLVEQSIAGIYIIQDDKLAYVNQRFADIYGYESADELIGRDPVSIVDDSDLGRVRDIMRRWSESGARSSSYEFTARRKDGSTVEVVINSTRATYRGRAAFIGLMQDISDKKRAEAEMVRHVAELRSALMSTVQVATTMSELRDPYTAGHERRVGEIAVAIAGELGFDQSRLEGLRIAGYLHDIGKITIPAEILAKPDKLSAIEFQLIRTHVQVSYDVLKEVQFPWPVAEVVLQHHERMDGSGYPQGLKGEAILMEARILAVADVVEAMSSHRPYRPSLGNEAALAEIESGSGTVYDAVVADACLKLFREKGYEIPDGRSNSPRRDGLDYDASGVMVIRAAASLRR